MQTRLFFVLKPSAKIGRLHLKLGASLCMLF
jgi:hypothetical protein